MIAQIVGEPTVDAAVDCVGFEARGHGAGEIGNAAASPIVLEVDQEIAHNRAARQRGGRVVIAETASAMNPLRQYSRAIP